MIKNIFWDVDGVLANLNHAYYRFLTEHPKYQERHRQLKFADLPKALPIDTEKYGALELSTHPIYGEEYNAEFIKSEDFFNDRPLYVGTVEVLKELHELGYQQFTLTETGAGVERKRALVTNLLGEASNFISIVAIEHAKVMHSGNKANGLKTCMEKYQLKPEESIFVDDRIYNIRSAIEVGVIPVRFRSQFTTDTPKDLSWVKEVRDIYELRDWLLKTNE